MNAEYEARLTDAKKAADEARLKNEQTVNNVFANLRLGDYMNAMELSEKMSAGLSAHSRAAFEVNKAATLANATIKGIEAVMNAFADGSKTSVWYGLAEAAIAGVYAVGQIGAISSTQYGGGGGGSISSGSGGGVPSLSTSVGTPVNVQNAPTATAQGTAAAAQRTVNINMTGGDQFYSADAIRNQLIPALNEAVGDGVVINVGSA